MGFARIEKVRLDHSTPPRKRNDGGSGEPVVHPRPLAGAQRSRRAQEEGPPRHRTQPVRRRAPAHGQSPDSTGSGPRARPFEPQADERLAEGRSLEDRGKTSYAAMVTTTKSSDRPCVTSTCRGCRPKGSPPRSRWSSSTSTNPSAHVNVTASMRRAPRRARIEAAAGIGALRSPGQTYGAPPYPGHVSDFLTDAWFAEIADRAQAPRFRRVSPSRSSRSSKATR